MKPIIDHTSFGQITVSGESYGHDIFITPGGEVKKRKKKLSREIYGTSHIISLTEITYIFRDDPEGLIIGTGQYGVAELSGEAKEFLHKEKCKIILEKTPAAIQKWNTVEGKWIGLFHVTC